MNYSNHGIFKCKSFVPSHYVSDINLDVVPSFSVFSEFDFVSQLNILLVWINEIFILKKNQNLFFKDKSIIPYF